jgi:RecA/RadA recombinase
MGVLEKLIKNSTIDKTDTVKASKYFGERAFVQTQVPMINVAFSGKLSGGLTSGLTQFAAPSRHFKTGFLLLCIRSYLDAYPDAACLFYDSEFGAPQSYFENFGIDMSRVVHTPITNIEQLKFDVMNQLENLEETDHAIIVIDSVGGLASKKEVEDALNENEAADMTRARQLKSLFRMVTPHLRIKDFPMVVVNHIYYTMEKFPKVVVGGGQGSFLASDAVFVVGRQQETEGTGKDRTLEGYKFVIAVEKSRYVKEKSKLVVEISFDEGLSTWSGLLDLAIESGHVTAEKQGWYERKGLKKSLRRSDTDTKEFWTPILNDPTFQEFVEKKYALPKGAILSVDDISGEDE